jgi:hypothetical protein
MTDIRKYRGFDPDGVAETEADHFRNCPICGALLDMRDLAQMLARVHIFTTPRLRLARVRSRLRARGQLL